jgi:hypothetical protein
MPDKWERTLDGLSICCIGRGHYLCKSQRSPTVRYTIDLEFHEGLGQCDCADFALRRFPIWKSVQANYDHLRCKHIRAIRNHFLDQILAHYAKTNLTDE